MTLPTHLNPKPQPSEPRIVTVSQEALNIRGAELVYSADELPLPLAALNPDAGRYWISPRRFFIGRYLLILALLSLWISGELRLIDNPIWIACEAVVFLAGLVLIFARKKLLLAWFTCSDGSRILNIVRSEVDARSFEQFVDNLSNQIKAAQGGFRV